MKQERFSPSYSSKRIIKYQGAVIWLTGLSGAGKTTIGDGLAKLLSTKKIPVERLDGNLVKGCFGPRANFKRMDHEFNVRIAAFVASLLEQHGIFTITSFISPHKKQRDLARSVSKNFIEVYINTPLDTCIKRDVKGYYKRALNGALKYFPGIAYPYEVPTKPDLTINTHTMNVKASVAMIYDYLRQKQLLQ